MAFYASGLPSVAAATTDLWPSISSVLRAPWRATITAASNPPARQHTAKIEAGAALPQQEARDIPTTSSSLPEFFQSGHIPQLHPTTTLNAAPIDIRDSIVSMPRQTILASNPHLGLSFGSKTSNHARNGVARDALLRASLGTFKLHTSGSGLAAARLYSTLRQPLTSANLRGSFIRHNLGYQARGFGSAGVSQTLLATREAAANRNPTSATAQNAFYQVLFKANMPHIVVERYRSGRFAHNDAGIQAYQRALGMISTSAGGAGASNHVGGIPTGNTQLNPTELQAVGQAIAAQNHGATVAASKGPQGTGARDSPIHVVVDQPWGETAFKWIKFAMWFSLITYFSLVVITMIIESLTVFKRPGANSKSDFEVKPENQTTKLADVHGCEEAKEEVADLVEFLKNPEKFNTLGGKLPKGILLVGPPGTGKTLLARAVAGEAGVPFFYASGSEFDEIYVGVGAKRVRELFTAAKSKSPAIIFIDELDAIGSRRSSRDAAYVKQTLNQLLTELDGFDQNSGIIIIAATNFPQMLDKALTRPGRFDRTVAVDLPDVRGRAGILKHHGKKIKYEESADLMAIAQLTTGMSGAELESIINQAAIRASKAKAKLVSQADFLWALDNVRMGAEKKSMVITPKEKEMTAYHEAGHALVNYYSEKKTLHKVTVLPRGQSLGHTAQLPEMDKYSWTIKDFMRSMDISMGGKVAEELAYGSEMVTSGASSDLQSATSIAFQMVAQLGMSAVGYMAWNGNYNHLSSETRALMETEVRKTLNESYERSKELLLKHRKELDLLAKALVEYETLNLEEITKVLAGEKLPGRISVPKDKGMVVPRPQKEEGPPSMPLPNPGGNKPTPPPPAPPPPA